MTDPKWDPNLPGICCQESTKGVGEKDVHLKPTKVSKRESYSMNIRMDYFLANKGPVYRKPLPGI